ncbi:SIS domain-containing protein [Armatimonas sp.]|uniref:D-sedoheptulose-7-phosphate isomerase n=1 Tax=Armatimonas sp. TaxID=1872638 RepID=UPI00286C2CFA|nr:SIS domain-containing protein [Armatimonas sp.]
MSDILPDTGHGTPAYVADYISKLTMLLTQISTEQVSLVADLLFDCWQNNRRLVFCGNGGSGATSTHMVCDFQKNIWLDGGKPFEVVSLTDSPALLLAWANDTDFSNVFAGQARTWLRKDDILIAISGSGNSPNVLEAVKVAQEVGAISIGLCGYGGGKLAELADHALVADLRNMQLVEDIHMILCHILFSVLRDRIKGILSA